MGGAVIADGAGGRIGVEVVGGCRRRRRWGGTGTTMLARGGDSGRQGGVCHKIPILVPQPHFGSNPSLSTLFCLRGRRTRPCSCSAILNLQHLPPPPPCTRPHLPQQQKQQRSFQMASHFQNMGDRASEGVKRPRQQQGEEEDAQPAPLHLTAHPTLPLPLLSVAQSYLG